MTKPIIKTVKLADIHEFDGNPRQIKKDDFERLKKSLKEFPEMLDVREIVIDEDGAILGGNQRYKALLANGETEATVKQVVGWSEAKKREFVIKDNIANGEWDMDTLANQWDDLPLNEWGMEIDWEEPKDEIVEDEVPEPPEEPKAKLGDIYQLGEHRLMCGDSTKPEDVEKLMGSDKADMVFTDPPYGVSYTEKNEYLNRIGGGDRLTNPIENDSMEPTDMYDFWVKSFTLMHEHTSDRMAYYITAPQGGDLLLLLLQAVRDSGFMLKHQIIWNKNNHVLGRCDYNYKHEPIIYGWKIGGTHNFIGGSKYKTSVWDIPKPLHNDLHPTMKPIELIIACLQDNSEKGYAVIDLFGGSGSTLIACEQLDRKCYMMELDPHYVDVIIERWEKFTGQKSIKL